MTFLKSLAIAGAMASLGACSTMSATQTAPDVTEKDPGCEFRTYTVAPTTGFEEVGVVDVKPASTWAYRSLSDFQADVARHVCKLGGDAIIVWSDHLGRYIKATVLVSKPQ